MGYDITIVAAQIATNTATAWHEVEELAEKECTEKDRFSAFFDLIEQRYPCPSCLSEEEGEYTVWKDFPLRSTVTGKVAHLSILFSRAAEVLPFVIGKAYESNMSVFDWSTRHIYSGGGFSDTKLDIEGRPTLFFPKIDQVVEAIDNLAPGSGSGFLILSGPDLDYCQVAGGKSGYTLEWREYRGENYTHCIAGNVGLAIDSLNKVSNNGFYVVVNSNEKINQDSVILIVIACLKTGKCPANFTWRARDF